MTTFEWQPIETAPRDETSLLLWDGANMEIGAWRAWERNKNGLAIGLETKLPSRYVDGWIWMSEGFCVNPTHWMPLPEPPK